MLRIRAPRLGDGRAIGRVHVRAWKAAYRDLLPASFLDGLDEDDGGAAWEDRLAGEPIPTVPDLDHRLLVAESAADLTGRPDTTDIVGIATVGPDREDPSRDTGELWMINVRPDAWGSGAGSRLLREAERVMAELGYRRAVLWVIAGNTRARAFYERHGWRSDGTEKREEIGGRVVRELRYVLGDLRPAVSS